MRFVRLSIIFHLSILLFVLCNSGCAADDKIPPYGPGHDGVPDIIGDESIYDTYWFARIEVSELNRLSGQDAGHDSVVSAYFTDFTHYRVRLADVIPFSDACYVYTGMPSDVKFCRPNQSCSPDLACPETFECVDDNCVPKIYTCSEQQPCPGILACQDNLCRLPECLENTCAEPFECLAGPRLPLQVEKMIFSGLSGGGLELYPSSVGRFQDILPGRVFEQPRLTVQAVSPPYQDRSFPAFIEKIQAPDAPVVTRLNNVQDPNLAVSFSMGIGLERAESLIVEWKPGDADYMEIKIIPGAGSKTPFAKLRCITYDDGGLEIPVEAINYLALDEATNFRFKLERHYFVEHPIMENDTLKAMALLDAGSVLESTVLR